jgi:hypothetical protein
MLETPIGFGKLRINQQGVHLATSLRRRAAGAEKSPGLNSAVSFSAQTKAAAPEYAHCRLIKSALLGTQKLCKGVTLQRSNLYQDQILVVLTPCEALSALPHSDNGTSSTNQVKDKHDQRDYQQQVNQAATKMKAESQKP